MSDPDGRLSGWYLVPPLATLVLIWPMVEGLPPLKSSSNFNALQIIIVLPFYLGLAAAPGWLYAWAGHYDRSGLSSGQRWWVGGSLWAALLASVGGLTTILAVVPFPAVVGSLVVSLFMLRRYYTSPRAEHSNATD